MVSNFEPLPYLKYIFNNYSMSARWICNDRTDEVNELFIIWPFHYGPEPAIN